MFYLLASLFMGTAHIAQKEKDFGNYQAYMYNIDKYKSIYILLFLSVTTILKISQLEIFTYIIYENPSDFYIK